MEETSIKKLKELTNFDEGIITLSLQDLQEKDLITMSGEAENLSIKVKQKLNPLSCLELPSVFENESIMKFKKYFDLSSFEEEFNQILAQVNEYKEKYREEDVTAEDEKEIAKRVIFIIKEHSNQLNQRPDSKLIKIISKHNYEKIKEFQPFKVFYFMTIFKDNGVVIFSQTSQTLYEMP